MSTNVNGRTITFSGSGVLTANIVSTSLQALYLSDITNVIIDGYTSIGSNAFEDAGTVTSIYIPNTVTSIGQSAFSNSSITTISIPSSVTSIGQSALNNSMISTIHVALDNSYYESDINGSQLSIQKIEIQAKNGKLSYKIMNRYG